MQQVKDIGLEKDLREFFNALPKSMRSVSVSRIYARALVGLRREIRANIPTSTKAHKFRGVNIQPGRLRKSIKIAANKKGDEPGATLYVSRSLRKGAPWGLWLEYGVSSRRKGSVPAQPFFRPAVDTIQPKLEREVEKAMQRYAERELDKAVAKLNRRANKQIINL